MRVVFYKTFLCPRCFLAGRALARLQKELPELQVEIVEVTCDPLRAWQDGVRMLPAMRCGDRSLSGLFLDYRAIRNFISP